MKVLGKIPHRFMAPFSPLYFFYFFYARETHLCASFIRKRTLLFFCADCFLVTRAHNTMSCHTHQWPIKQGTWKGRNYGWHKTVTCFVVFFIPITETNSGHHSRSLKNICQPLVATTWEYNWTLVSIRLRVSGLHSVTRRSSAVKSEPASLWR